MAIFNSHKVWTGSSALQPKDDRYDDRGFDGLLAAFGGYEAPACNDLPGCFIQAFKITAFFQVDRSRQAVGANAYPEQNFTLLTQTP